MHFEGIFIGFFSFAVIGVFHPIVMKGEYYFSRRIWPLYLCAGIMLTVISCFIGHTVVSSVLSVLGFYCFWNIGQHREIQEGVKGEAGVAGTAAAADGKGCFESFQNQ